ncbi:MAG: hypothetical protein BWY21_00337 [Parcubacteria group bacterium ADurb.Bin216]|nr:MAG: hypothetical protein BWY21_00337 [Parcubacteria group bacterium ADurb.Bin216]
MSDEERRSKFRQALDDAADKIGIKTIWSDALEQHKALEEAERRGEERGLLKAKELLLPILHQKRATGRNQSPTELFVNFDNLIGNVYSDLGQAISDWRASEEYKEGK